MTPADYVKPTLLGNFRKAWEELDPETEKEDEYGLGQREGLQVRRPNHTSQQRMQGL